MKRMDIDALAKAIALGEHHNYNRQATQALVEHVRQNGGQVDIEFDQHHQRHGEPYEAHARCIVRLHGSPMAVVDMPVEFYDALPSVDQRAVA